MIWNFKKPYHGLQPEGEMNHYEINELLPRMRSGNYKSWWFKRYSYVLNDITYCWLKAVCHYFLPFSFLNHTNCNLELTKKKHKTGQNKQSHLPQPQCVGKRVIVYFFLVVNFRQIMWNSIFIKMSGKKTVFQRQHVSLSKKYNATGSGALYMQRGALKITRNDNKIRCWLQKLNL